MSAEYTTYFRNLWQQGCCTETHRGGKLVVECDVTEADVEIYPSLKGRKRVVFVETETGFEETSEVGGGKKKNVAAKRKKKKATKKKGAKQKPKKATKRKASKKKAAKKKPKKATKRKAPAKKKATVRVDVSIGGAAETRAEETTRLLDKAIEKIAPTIDRARALSWKVMRLFSYKGKHVYAVTVCGRDDPNLFCIHAGNFLAKTEADAKKKARTAFKKKLG